MSQTDNYSFEDAGFDKFLTRKTPEQEQILPDEASLNINNLSGGETSFGITASPDDNLKVNWDNNQISFSDKARVRTVIGFFPEEKKYGVRVIDSTGVTQLDETY
jgi:hypothetical protein